MERGIAEVVVGHDLLQLLTSAMYADPMILFREYLQNAVDSIDSTIDEMDRDNRIHVEINANKRYIRIRDFGAGIGNDRFAEKMTAIGASGKRGLNLRGFRGIGRLVGLAYCKKLRFASRSADDHRVCTIEWDCVRLREMLSGPQSFPLVDAITALTTFASNDALDSPKHFFDVELLDVVRLTDDRLLNASNVRRFLSEVSPVSFSKSFAFGDTIQEFLSRYFPVSTVEIRVNQDSEPLARPYRDQIDVSSKRKSNISSIRTFELPAQDDGLAAIGWIADQDYLGSFPASLAIAGIRARYKNLQVGTASVFDSAFSEPRFNSWCIGEVHIFDARIVPNGRRDAFEPGVHLDNLLNQLSPIAADIIKRSRGSSHRRQVLRKLHSLNDGARKLSLVSRNRMAFVAIAAFVRRAEFELNTSSYKAESPIFPDSEVSIVRAEVALKLGVLKRRINGLEFSRAENAQISLLYDLFSSAATRDSVVNHLPLKK